MSGMPIGDVAKQVQRRRASTVRAILEEIESLPTGFSEREIDEVKRCVRDEINSYADAICGMLARAAEDDTQATMIREIHGVVVGSG